MREINLKMRQHQVEILLQAMMEVAMPFKASQPIITDLHNQLQAQLAEMAKAAPPAPVPSADQPAAG
jgi:hypothetical protein